MHIYDRFSFSIWINFWLPIPWIPTPLQGIRPIVIPRIRYVRRVHRNFSPFIEFAYFLDVDPDTADFGKLIAVLIEEYNGQFAFTLTRSLEKQTFFGIVV